MATKANVKAEIREQILKYIEEIYLKEDRLVSKREIRKVFHVELYNYFKNLFDMYQKIGVDVPLCFCPREYAIEKIVEFVRKRSDEGLYPMSRELENELGINISTYFKDIGEIYDKAGIDFRFYVQRRSQIESREHSDEELSIRKNKIIRFIKEKTRKGYYPSVPLIQKELNLSFYKYFKNVEDAYEKADIDYQRVCPTTLGKKKERLLTKVIIKLFKEMGYKIERVSIYDENFLNRGADLEVRDGHGNFMLVELSLIHI